MRIRTFYYLPPKAGFNWETGVAVGRYYPLPWASPERGRIAVGPRTAPAPAGWQSCLGRLPSPPQNDKIGFPRDWYTFEMPQPFRRPTPTRVGHPRRPRPR